MFAGNDGEDALHLIHLDVRYHRSPTFSDYGPCEGSRSTMLGAEQWGWLEEELARPSVIKVIASGIQVLPPLYTGRSLGDYCAHDMHGVNPDTSCKHGDGSASVAFFAYSMHAPVASARG